MLSMKAIVPAEASPGFSTYEQNASGVGEQKVVQRTYKTIHLEGAGGGGKQKVGVKAARIEDPAVVWGGAGRRLDPAGAQHYAYWRAKFPVAELDLPPRP